MLRPTSAPRRTRSGAAAAELAVLLPILFFLFAIAVDYGRIFYFTQTVRSAARNGAYYAANYTPSYTYMSGSQVANADLTSLSPSPNVIFYYSSSATGPFTSTTPTTTGYVKCQVTWTFRSITRFPLVPQQKNLLGSSIMKIAPAEPTTYH
jgi:Flp pilus assembly protein TadG